MKKIRINELARELEVKAHEILDRLPELGVTEKKTHSSSIDEDVAIKLRRLYGYPDLGPGGEAHAEFETEPSAPPQREEGPAGLDGQPAAPATTPGPAGTPAGHPVAVERPSVEARQAPAAEE